MAKQSIQQPLDPTFEVNQRFELLLFFVQMGLLDAQFLKLHAHGSNMVQSATVEQGWGTLLQRLIGWILDSLKSEQEASDGCNAHPKTFDHHEVGSWSLDSPSTQRRAAL